jgi:uncharacterized protein YeaO (DUF488 family)
MAIRIVQLGCPRLDGEGLRLGTVRRPPRGVTKAEFATRDDYDVGLPELSPSTELMKQGQDAQDKASGKDWSGFVKKFRRELAEPQTSRLLDLLAALSHRTSMAIGCYCVDESRCHRSVLRVLLGERGADLI